MKTYKKIIVFMICIAIRLSIFIIDLRRMEGSTSVNTDGLSTTGKHTTIKECKRKYISINKYPCEWTEK